MVICLSLFNPFLVLYFSHVICMASAARKALDSLCSEEQVAVLDACLSHLTSALWTTDYHCCVDVSPTLLTKMLYIPLN